MLVTARRFNELGLVDGALDPPTGVEGRPRTVSAPDRPPVAGAGPVITGRTGERVRGEAPGGAVSVL